MTFSSLLEEKTTSFVFTFFCLGQNGHRFFAYGRSTGQPSQRPTIECVSNPAHPSAVSVLQFSSTALGKQSLGVRRHRVCRLPLARAASVTKSNVRRTVSHSSRMLYSSVGAEKHNRLHCPFRARPCHMPASCRIPFSCSARVNSVDPHVGGHHTKTEPVRVVQQFSFPFFQKVLLAFNFHGFRRDPEKNNKASTYDARPVIVPFVRPAINHIHLCHSVGEAGIGPERTALSQDQFFCSRASPWCRPNMPVGSIRKRLAYFLEASTSNSPPTMRDATATLRHRHGWGLEACATSSWHTKG